MRKLWVIEIRTKRKRVWIPSYYCPSKSAAVFMIGRIYENNKVYRIVEMELAGEKLFYSDLFCGHYNSDGVRVFGDKK